MTPKLTLSIPTFDRPEALRETVERLVPQLDGRVALRVLDNASEVPAAEALGSAVERLRERGVRVDVVRNRTNIGMAGNILRCFELCDTEWNLVLGDDDPPEPRLVESVLAELDAHPSATLVFFSSVFERFDRAFTTRGAEQMLAALRSGTSLAFLPNIAYRREAQRHLSDGYHAASSYVPFVVLALKALGEDGITAFTPRALVEHRDAPPGEKWSAIRVALGVGSLLELPFPPGVRRELGRLVQGMIGPPTFFAVQLLLDRAVPELPSYRRFVFQQIRRRLFAFAPAGVALQARALEELFRFPRASLMLIRAAYRVRKGKGYYQRWIEPEAARSASNRG